MLNNVHKQKFDGFYLNFAVIMVNSTNIRAYSVSFSFCWFFLGGGCFLNSQHARNSLICTTVEHGSEMNTEKIHKKH